MLQPGEVKKFIKHPDRSVRQYVMEYFCESNLKSLEITNLLLDAYHECEVSQPEKWSILSYMSTLPQSVETLERIFKIAATDFNIRWHKELAIVKADLELLKQVPDIRPSEKKYQEIIDTRFKIASWETDEIWNRLWEYSALCENKEYQDFNFNYIELLINELKKRDDFPYDKYFSMLEKVYPPEYYGWEDAILCTLAGELGHEAAIPFLIRSLMIEGDFLQERATEALWKIGTDNVVSAIREAYLSDKEFFRLYAVDALENIKSASCEELLIELLSKEKNIQCKTDLGHGLCKLFSSKGIPLVLSLIKNGYDRMMVNLEEAVYVSHVVNGLNHRNMVMWKKNIEEEDRRMQTAEQDTENGNVNLQELLEQLRSSSSIAGKSEQSMDQVKKAKVGRNDPCPCGSGKKYKKCCLGK